MHMYASADQFLLDAPLLVSANKYVVALQQDVQQSKGLDGQACQGQQQFDRGWLEYQGEQTMIGRHM